MTARMGQIALIAGRRLRRRPRLHPAQGTGHRALGTRAPWHSRELLPAACIVAMTTIVATWPLVLRPWSIPAHQDPLFSAWRLYQWSRNLFEQPFQLFQGNIFHPAPDVLLYSDAVALPAILAAPWIRLGLPPLLAYDALVAASFMTAGLAMYLFARDLSGSRIGAIAAAIVFTGAPYRIEHLFHIELLWTCWMPLASWALWRAFQGRSFARLLGISVVAQLLCSIYYGLYLVAVLPIVAGLAWIARPVRFPRRVWLRLGAAGLVVVLAAMAYGRPYTRARESLGDRSEHEIDSYSAEAINYGAAPAGNVMWGWTADTMGGREKRLSAGVIAYALAAPALLAPLQPWTLGLVGGAAFSFDASRGLRGFVYPILYRVASPFRGLRVPARFAALVLAFVAALAAIGVARIERRFGASRRWPLLAGAIVAALLVECATANQTRPLPSRAPSLYAWLGSQAPGVIAHFPMPRPDALPGHEADYQYFAQYHRHELVNGNSGYYPRSYLQLLERVRRFPDARSLNALRAAGVSIVIVHAQHYAPDDYGRVTVGLETRPDVEWVGTFLDESGAARVYRLN